MCDQIDFCIIHIIFFEIVIADDEINNISIFEFHCKSMSVFITSMNNSNVVVQKNQKNKIKRCW